MIKLIKQGVWATLFFVCVGLTGQQKEVNINIHKLTNNTFMLEGRGGNIVVFIGEDGVFMIDDQFAPLAPKITSAIKSITNKPLRYVINTHWHGDHTGGNLAMANEGAVIVSHKNVRKRMSMDQVIRGRTRKKAPQKALPVITFSEDVMYHFNGDEVFISHIHKAHTDGDALVFFMSNNVLHMGDAYFQGKFPYIDLDSGGSINGYIDGIKKAIMLIDRNTKVVPGHGKVSDKKEMQAYVSMLEEIKNRVLAQISEGKSLQEVKKNKSITRGFEAYNGWITEEKIRETVYKSLQSSLKHQK